MIPGRDFSTQGTAISTAASTGGPAFPNHMGLAAIEFPAVLQLVAANAASELAAAELCALRPSLDQVWIAEQLQLVGELLAAMRRGEALDIAPVPDIRSSLHRLMLPGSVLELIDLHELRVTLRVAREAGQRLHRLAGLCPHLALLYLPPLDSGLERKLDQSIGDDGELLDSASSGLAAARREVHAARQRLIKRLEGVLHGLDSGAASAGATVTLRGGRYVIPVRRDARQRPEGIIHDESAGGGTLFLEPSATIELGNAMREAILAEGREVLKVLRELTDLLRPHGLEISALHRMVIDLDSISARARWAYEMRGEVPTLSGRAGALVLNQARHPLLLSRGVKVVPFDLVMDRKERTLLITGPNTGGKTVLLKTAALMITLTQAGIIPPIGSDSVVPQIQQLFVDIGDNQSLASDLSTFSAHVAAIRELLQDADAGSLVILDEVGSGTDPAEGGALAMAVLETLTQRQVLTLATTHLGALKQLAARVPGVVNGSLQFDMETISPTYRFTKGIPGRSYGLAIARRLGIDSTVLSRAEAMVPEAERQLDRLLATVELRGQSLDAAEAALIERETELGSQEARLALKQAELERREVEWNDRERTAERDRSRQAKAYLMEARKKVEEALALAQGAADQAGAKAARRLVEAGIRVEQERLEARTLIQAGVGATPVPGDRVRMATGAVGELNEVRTDGKAVVLAGAMRLVVPMDSLSRISGPTQEKKPVLVQLDEPTAEQEWEIDLRGMRADEAESAVWNALDGAVLTEQPFLRIIHGMGTGVLRDLVRRMLAADSRVASFEFAARNQGGTGVTLVNFR